MNMKFKKILANFSYTITSNIISLIISTLVILIIPKIIGVEEYGYWQLYMFYTSYLGFFNIGWVEGFYLRYAGEEYNNLNKNLFASQFWSFFLYIIVSGFVIFLYSYVGVMDYDRRYILQMVSLCLISSVPRGFLLFILESTNRIKEYSMITIFDRIIYCIFVILMILSGIRDYKLLVAADLIGKVITFIIAISICKEIVFSRLASIKDNSKELIINISVGVKLMIANIASMLIIGVVRFGIERTWDVKTFGKISLTLSVSNLMMLFISAVGIIMFPILRRTDKKKLTSIYTTMRDFVMLILLGALVLYYPFRVILSTWLPQYAESLKYMALVFPMCVFEGKIALLINTYLKTLREEKLMLKINLLTVALSLICTYISTALLTNLNLAIVSIVMLLAFRCVLTEVFLSRILSMSLYKDIVLELILVFIFMVTGWYVSSLVAMLLYVAAYITYILIKRKDLKKTIKNIELLVRA